MIINLTNKAIKAISHEKIFNVYLQDGDKNQLA